MDEITATAAQAATDTPPQGGTTETAAPAQAADAVDVSRVARELEEARKEAARYRTERKALEAKLAAFEAQQKAAEEAQLSDLERARKEADTLKAQVAAIEAEKAALAERTRLLATQQAFNGEAVKAGISHADAAWKLLDKEQIDYSDDGSPKNLDKLAKGLVTAYPFLVATAAPMTSPTNAPATREPGQAERAAAIEEKVYGRPRGIFDPGFVKTHGGGVVNRDE